MTFEWLRASIAQTGNSPPNGEHKGRTDTVDQQTKAALKQDKFVSTTTHGLEWASDHRKSVLVNGAIVLVALVLGLACYFVLGSAGSGR